MDSWQSLQQWAVEYDFYRKVSAFLYVVFAVGFFDLGAKYHASKLGKITGVNEFPPGYFVMLAIQLLPLAITGLVIHDAYIIGTRFGTLVVVLLVYGMIASADGTFTRWWYKLWLTWWFSVAILGPMVWTQSADVQSFVHDYQNLIEGLTIVLMLLFVIKGQWDVAKALFRHYREGNYTVRRFWLQVDRFFAFLLQAIAYWLVPSSADPFFGIDPIFLQGAMGALGVAGVLAASFYGFIRGTRARRQRRASMRKQ